MAAKMASAVTIEGRKIVADEIASLGKHAGKAS